LLIEDWAHSTVTLLSSLKGSAEINLFRLSLVTILTTKEEKNWSFLYVLGKDQFFFRKTLII
jgi:hypothetical protein